MRIPSGSYRHQLRAHLKRGGIIAYPTESCFGLGCLPYHTVALKRLMRLKKRPHDKGLLIIGKNFEQLKPYTSFRQPEKLKSYWATQSISFLLPTAPHRVSPLLRGKQRQKIGVRIPFHAGAKQLCGVFNTALVSTSANYHHQQTCTNIREIQHRFGKKVLLISGQIGKNRRPSVIMDWENGQILR